jgi:hypothetical protein
VYVTHGHQYSDDNQIDVPVNFTFNRLNSCWGTHFVEHFFNQVEERYPLLDNARPMWKVVLSAILHEAVLVTGQFAAEFLMFLKNFRIPLKDYASSAIMGWKPKSRALRQKDIDSLTSDIQIDVLRERLQELRGNKQFRREFDAAFQELDDAQWERVFSRRGNTENELLRCVQNTESRPQPRSMFSQTDNYQQAAQFIARYHPEVEAVVMGHTHHGVEGTTLEVEGKKDSFLYFNTGTWTKTYDIPWWKLPNLEKLFEADRYASNSSVVRCTGAGDKLEVKYFTHWSDAVKM